jgi:peptidoglycan/LPS O-acetylase OafA/YrhL
LLPNFAFAPAFVVLILYLTRENISSRVLGSTLAIALGEISYAVYLLQHQYFVKFGWIDIPVLRMAAHVAFITGMAGLYFLLYEAPMRWLIRTVLIRRNKPATQPALLRAEL